MIKLFKIILKAKSVYCQDNLQKFRSGALLLRLMSKRGREVLIKRAAYTLKKHTPKAKGFRGAFFFKICRPAGLRLMRSRSAPYFARRYQRRLKNEAQAARGEHDAEFKNIRNDTGCRNHKKNDERYSAKIPKLLF